MPNTNPIELAGARIFGFKDRGVLYRFSFSPITAGQWRDYFNTISTTSETDGKEVINVTETRSAKLGLVLSAISSAEGYQLPEGTSIHDILDWKSKLPLAHRMVLGDLLVATQRFQPGPGHLEPLALSLGEEKVEIESNWAWDDERGAITKVAPLTHFFETPSPDHLRRFNRDSSRSKTVGGSRTQKTVWMGPQLTLMALYDELILRAEGYVYDETPLNDRAACAARMDGFHKVVAAAQLFAAAEVDGD